jgi:sterol desaturase/sphingolipid hydroxylase (fatty acid hydroxylase superfamily)
MDTFLNPLNNSAREVAFKQRLRQDFEEHFSKLRGRDLANVKELGLESVYVLKVCFPKRCFIAPPVLEYVGISAYAPFPSGRRLVVDLLFCMFVEDVFQYIFHRMLHLPSIYPLIHKVSFVCLFVGFSCLGVFAESSDQVHHEWSTPFAMAASYAHPAEIFILALAAFAGPLFCRPHLASFFAWLLFRQMDAVKTHSGWAWPGIDHVLHYIPYYEGAVFHDFHHRSFIFNYASRFTFIDVIFGTYKVPYDPLKVSKSESSNKSNVSAVTATSTRASSSSRVEEMQRGNPVEEAPFVFETKKSPKKRTASPRRSSPRRKS